jgi:cobalt/nickel transport system permease protein
VHIPDNYLSPVTCAVMAAAVAPAWILSVKKVKKELPKAKLPQLGVCAALSFLMMMYNVPLIGGTTGHAVGGTLIAILLGPSAACVSVSVALLLQALLFGDGGILSFGANCFNMAFVLPFVGYYVYRFIKERIRSRSGEYIGAAVGSYFGIVVASLCAAVEFGVQPLLFRTTAGQPLYCPYSLAVSIPAMVIPHLLIAGPVEILFTVLILAFVKKVSPDLAERVPEKKTKGIWGLLLALVCAAPLGLLASGTAWGEWDAAELTEIAGFTPRGMADGFRFSALLPDYSITGLPEAAGYILSAVLGAAVLVIVFKLLSDVRKPTKQN